MKKCFKINVMNQLKNLPELNNFIRFQFLNQATLSSQSKSAKHLRTYMYLLMAKQAFQSPALNTYDRS